MVNYKELTQTLSKSVASILSSTGSYTSRQTPSSILYDDIAKRAMEYEGPMRNPVILIHGFFGSSLVDRYSGINLWGNFDIKETVGVSPEKMHKLAHPMKLGIPITELRQSVEAEKLLEEINIQLMGLPIKLPAYKDLVDILIKGGFQPSHHQLRKNKTFHSLFLFAYDWRCDLQQNARRLHKFIINKKQYIKDTYRELYGIKNHNVQFDVIAHSMGGLIARYYLRYGQQNLPIDGSLPALTWAGTKNLDRVIIVGTPNAGYLDTFMEMLHGSPIQPYPTTVLGTLPSYYQMLPAPATQSIIFQQNKEPVDVFDPELWIKMKWGLVNPENDEILKLIIPKIRTAKDRRNTAIDHLIKCLIRSKQFIRAMSIPAKAPEDINLHLVCGNGIKTTRRAAVDRKTGQVKIVEHGPGDGKVLTTSALWDERAADKPEAHFLTTPIDWTSIMLLRSAHMGITKAPGFEDNLLFLLTMKESPKQKTLIAKEKILELSVNQNLGGR